MMNLGEGLRSAREGRGLSQQALANRFHVTRQTVSRWENGDRYPDIMTLKKLAVFYGISVDALLSGEDFAVMPEKLPVIESPALKQFLAILYALSTYLLLDQCVRSLLVFPEFLGGGINGSVVYLSSLLLVSILKAGLFAYGLWMLLSSSDTPRRTGLIIVFFFLADGLQGIPSLVLFAAQGMPTVLGILLLVLNATGAVCSFLYYGKEHDSSLIRGALYCVFFLVLARMTGSAVLLFSTVEGYWQNGFNVPAVLNFLVYSSFFLQTYRLSEKRKLAREEL